MKDGALGLSSMLASPRGSLATTDDIVELCKVVERHGGIFSIAHPQRGTGRLRRDQGSDRHRRAGRSAGGHHPSQDRRPELWGRMNEVVALIDEARRAGVNVQANVYPYTRGNNDLASIIPPWAHEGGNAADAGPAQGPRMRDRLKNDIKDGLAGLVQPLHGGRRRLVPDARQRQLTPGEPAVSGPDHGPDHRGERQGTDPAPDPLDVLFDLLIEEGGSVARSTPITPKKT